MIIDLLFKTCFQYFGQSNELDVNYPTRQVGLLDLMRNPLLLLLLLLFLRPNTNNKYKRQIQTTNTNDEYKRQTQTANTELQIQNDK